MVVGEIVSSAEPRFKAIGPGDRYCLLLRPCVNRVGRHNDVYVLSDVTFGDTGDELIVPSARTFSADMGTRGSLQNWRKNVGRLCEVNPLPSLLSHGHAGGAHFMSFNSGVALELLGSYSYYTSTTTEYLRDKPVVAKIARRAFPGAAIIGSIWRFFERHGISVKKNRARRRAGQAGRGRRAPAMAARSGHA